MINNLQKLTEILNEEIRLYRRYLELSQADKDFMLKLDLPALEQANKEKATIILKLQIADKSRQHITRLIAREKSMNPEDMTITKLAKRVTEGEALNLLKLKDTLSKLMNEVKEINEHNRFFATSSLRWMNTSLNYLKDYLTPTIYSQKGKVVEGVMNGKMIERQA